MVPPSRLVFGIAAHAASRATSNRTNQVLARLGDLAKREIQPQVAQSYDGLAAMFGRQEIHFAWLPPIPFLALEGANLAFPLVVHHRGGHATFESVVIGREGSPIATLFGLKGKRVAWVDPLSASGYVVPRIQLAALGIDPRTAFSSERFYGSHEAVVRAVVGGKADIAATYARAETDGLSFHGAWDELPGAEKAVRVVARFGAIPSDVIAAHQQLDLGTCEALTRAFEALSSDPEGLELARAVFGVDEFRRWGAGAEAAYEPLRKAMSEAAARGLLDAVDTPSA